jgi:hypothetical protein
MSCTAKIDEGLKMKSSSGGIGGSGIFGMFGTVIQCKSDDTTWFCMLSKFVNTLILLMIVFYFISIAFDFFKSFTSNKKMKGGSAWRAIK